ncbi:family 16 glycosylhydrolase [Epibacterium ulvae]|uniref:glycoside hydrolase family 16 protein n=1 Tax=Epibacterium ulvae TaxID=1156985 RepID=UPI00334263B2|nr:family 16 glycosylhydrolase [Epibacterium ulvae]
MILLAGGCSGVGLYVLGEKPTIWDVKGHKGSSVVIRFFTCMALLIAPPAFAAPALDGTIPILEERFENGLDRYDGTRGLWSTLPRRGQLMTNAAQSVFLDYGVLGDAADAVLPELHEVTKDGLILRSAPVPEAALGPLRQYMQQTGQGKRADAIRYAVGEITTAHTWSQKYGYFEVEARLPRGKGRWPAFWMTFAGLGWPPEIDVMEAYGAGIYTPTKKDNAVNTAVYFDRLNHDREPVHEVEITNPFGRTPDEIVPKSKERGKNTVYNFKRTFDALAEYDSNIYDDFHTYAALWTPEHVIFYFGKTRDSLQEVYRTPTPDDVHEPMFVIANDQFTARGGFWSPQKNAIEAVLDPENAYRIRSITVRALEPQLALDLNQGDDLFDARDSVIHDTKGDDVIAPGAGFDIIHLSGGADRILLTRDKEQKVIAGFGRDDQIQLEGYPVIDAKDAMSRLTQVGDDVWLPTGADPAWPHTIVFRDTKVSAFRAKQFDVKWPVARDLWRAEAVRPNRPETDQDGDGVLVGAQPGAWLNDMANPVRMTGTALSDRYVVAHARTMLDEPTEGGIDTIWARVNYTLPETVEVGILQKSKAQMRASQRGARLEAGANYVILEGGGGDDLFVINPNSRNCAIKINAGGGHDHLRGFHSDHRLALDQKLLASQGNWTITKAPQGTLIAFSDTQTLLIEGLAPEQVQQILING